MSASELMKRNKIPAGFQLAGGLAALALNAPGWCYFLLMLASAAVWIWNSKDTPEQAATVLEALPAAVVDGGRAETADEIGFSSDIRLLTGEVNRAITTQVVSLGTELDQIRDLTSHAVTDLALSFNRLNELVRKQSTSIHGLLSIEGNEHHSSVNIKSFVAETSHLMQAFTGILERSTDQNRELLGWVDQLADAMEGIFGLLGNIKQIAHSSNLVALNASIEAARAGAQGGAFAVVAAEVRSLSKTSAKLSDEIRDRVMVAQGVLDDIRGKESQAIEQADSGEVTSDLRSKVGTLMDGLREMDDHLEHSVAQMEQVSAEISDKTAAAVRSLQFEDIVRQVAEHAEGTVLHINQFLEEYTSRMEGTRFTPHEVTHLRELMEASLARWESRTERKIVTQTCMSEGDVELF